MSYNPIRYPAGTPEAEAAIAKAEAKRARKAAKRRESFNLWGMPVRVDPSIPEGTIEFRDPVSDEVVGCIVGLAK